MDTKAQKTSGLAPWLVFPLLMGSGLSGVYFLLASGVHEGIAVFSIIATAAITIAILERAMPYREMWNQSDDDIKTDFIHLLIAQVTIPRLIKPLWIAALASTTAALSNIFGNGLWPHEWPLLAQLFLMLTIAEFGRYWVHRWAHRVPVLWRFHAVHHSPNRLYWMNAGRFHPIEKVYLLIPEVVPFILLGTNLETLSLYFVFNGIHGLLQHSNINLKLGPLNYIFSMSELHRWHHSKRVFESDKNFGNNLIIWDIIFGTFYLPSDRAVKDLGLMNPEYPKSYIKQCLAPFHKERLHYPEKMREHIKKQGQLPPEKTESFTQ